MISEISFSNHLAIQNEVGTTNWIWNCNGNNYYRVQSIRVLCLSFSICSAMSGNPLQNVRLSSLSFHGGVYLVITCWDLLVLFLYLGQITHNLAQQATGVF